VVPGKASPFPAVYSKSILPQKSIQTALLITSHNLKSAHGHLPWKLQTLPVIHGLHPPVFGWFFISSLCGRLAMPHVQAQAKGYGG